MKTWGRGGIAPPCLTSELDGGEWSASCLCHFTPGKEPQVPVAEEAGWAPKLVWTLWRREKSYTNGTQEEMNPVKVGSLNNV
jgi:hypothetical protein